MKRYAAYLLVCVCLFFCACANQGAVGTATPDAQQSPAASTPEPALTEPAPTFEPTRTAEPTLSPSAVAGAFVVECEDAINMRKEPSSRAELAGTLAKGERVRVMEYVKNYAYVETLSNGTKGYVIAGYLKPEEDVFDCETVKITDCYTYEQMRADMDALAAAYPALASVSIIGQSVRGVEIPALIMGEVNAPHHVLVQAAIHAREHMTSLLAMALSESWLRSGGNPQVCFHVIPMTNPDGVKISQEAAYDEHTRQLYVNDYAAGLTEAEGEEYLREWKANYNGVDINRNFDAMWESVNTVAAPSSGDYRGEAPESEPETQGLVSYTRQYAFDATISYHATGSMIYWQFGPASEADKAAHALALVIGELAGYSVEFDDGKSFGGYKDWASSKLGIPSLTIEIGTRSAPLPEIDFYNIWLRNRFVFKTVAEWVKNA